MAEFIQLNWGLVAEMLWTW